MKKRFQPKFNIKKGDSVVVIAGDDKDRTTPRVIQAVYPQKGLVLVSYTHLDVYKRQAVLLSSAHWQN